MDATKM